MKKLSLIISLLYGTTMLHGCASTTTSESRNWTVEPFQRIQHATDRPDGYYRLGRFYQGQNRLDLAASAYRKALEIDPDFFEARNGLGTVYASQGKYDQALAEFNSVIAKVPGAAHVYNNIGYLKFLEGKYAEAVAAFNQSTLLDPANRKTWNNLGMALAKNGEPMKSNQAFTKAIEITAPARLGEGGVSSHAVTGSVGDQTVATLTIPKNRGVIDYTSANKSGSDHADHLNAANTSEDKSTHSTELAQTDSRLPFAVLETPNSSAMPVVEVNGIPLPATENEAKAQLHTKENKPAPVASNSIYPNSATNMMAAQKTDQKVQVTIASSKCADLQYSSNMAAPARLVRAASTPEERHFRLEVSNGNGINHLAAKVSSVLSARGLPKASLSNQKPFNQAKTVIHYRKGYLFEAARLSRDLRDIQQPALISESKNLPSRTDVKLVLGKDLYGKLHSIDKARLIALASY